MITTTTTNSSNMISLLYRNLSASVVFNKVFVMWQIIVPIAYIFIQGYAYSALLTAQGFNVIPLGNTNIPFIAFLATGAMSFVVIESAKLAGSIIQRDKHTGMFTQILVMPFSKYDYVGSILVTTIIVSFAGALLLLLAATPLLAGSVHYTFVGSLYIAYGILMGSG